MQAPRLTMVPTSPNARMDASLVKPLGKKAKKAKAAAAAAAAAAASDPVSKESELDLSGQRAAKGKLERALAGPRAATLRRLDVSRNHDAGPELLKPFPRFGGQLQIRSLNLSHNLVSDLSPVLALGPHLEELVATDNVVARLPRDMGRLQGLRTLGLAGNWLRLLGDVERLRGCACLASLELAGNPLSDVEHSRAFAVHQLRTLGILDGERVLPAERDHAAARFGTDETGTLREEKAALEEQLSRLLSDASESKKQAAQASSALDAKEAALSKANARLAVLDMDASYKGPMDESSRIGAQDASFSSFDASDVEGKMAKQRAEWLSSPRSFMHEMSAVGTVVGGGGDSSIAGTIVGELSPQADLSGGMSPQAVMRNDDRSASVLFTTIGDGLAELASCDTRYASALEGRWSAVVGGPSDVLHGFEDRVLRLLRHEERGLRHFVLEQAAADTEPDFKLALATVQSVVVTQMIDLFAAGGGADNGSPKVPEYVRTSAVAHDALRHVVQHKVDALRDGDEEPRSSDMLVRRWHQAIDQLQKKVDQADPTVADDAESSRLQHDDEDGVELNLSLAWRALADQSSIGTSDGTATTEQKLEGDLRLLVDRNGSLEREIAGLRESSTAQLDALRTASAEAVAEAAMRSRALEQESEALREKVGLINDQEEMGLLTDQNNALKLRVQSLETHSGRLEDDLAVALDAADEKASEHGAELRTVQEDCARRVQEAETLAAQEMDRVRSGHDHAMEGSSQHVADLESQIRQLEQQSKAHLIRGTASLDELTAENEALSETCNRQALEMQELAAGARGGDAMGDGSSEFEAQIAQLQAEHLAAQQHSMAQLQQLEQDLASLRVESAAHERNAEETAIREASQSAVSAQELQARTTASQDDMVRLQHESSGIQAALREQIGSQTELLQELEGRIEQLVDENARLSEELQAMREANAAQPMELATAAPAQEAAVASNSGFRMRQLDWEMNELRRENQALQGQLEESHTATTRTSFVRSSYESSTGLLQNELQQFNLQLMKANEDLRERTNLQINQLMQHNEELQERVTRAIRQADPHTPMPRPDVAHGTQIGLAEAGTQSSMSSGDIDDVAQANAQMRSEVAELQKEHVAMRSAMSHQIEELEQANTALQLQLDMAAPVSEEADDDVITEAVSSAERDMAKQQAVRVAQLQQTNAELKEQLTVQDLNASNLADLASAADAALRTLRGEVAELQKGSEASRSTKEYSADEHIIMAAQIQQLEGDNAKLQQQLASESAQAGKSLQTTQRSKMSRQIEEMEEANAALQAQLTDAALQLNADTPQDDDGSVRRSVVEKLEQENADLQDQLSAQDLSAGMPDVVQSTLLRILWGAVHTHRTLPNGRVCNDLPSFFAALDADDSGKISGRELQAAIENMDVWLSVPKLKWLLGLIDTDHDGSIKYTEFERWMLAGKLVSEATPQDDDGAVRWSLVERLEQENADLQDQLSVQDLSAAEADDASLQSLRDEVEGRQKQSEQSHSAMSRQIEDLERANTALHDELRSRSADLDATAELLELRKHNALLLERLSSAEKVLIQTQALMEQDSGRLLDLTDDSVLGDISALSGMKDDREDMDTVVIHTPAESVDGGHLADLERENVLLREAIEDAKTETRAAESEFSGRLQELLESANANKKRHADELDEMDEKLVDVEDKLKEERQTWNEQDVAHSRELELLQRKLQVGLEAQMLAEQRSVDLAAAAAENESLYHAATAELQQHQVTTGVASKWKLAAHLAAKEAAALARADAESKAAATSASLSTSSEEASALRLQVSDMRLKLDATQVEVDDGEAAWLRKYEAVETSRTQVQTELTAQVATLTTENASLFQRAKDVEAAHVAALQASSEPEKNPALELANRELQAQLAKAEATTAKLELSVAAHCEEQAGLRNTLVELQVTTESLQVRKTALERSLQAAKVSMREQAAAIEQVAEQASVDAQRASDAIAEIGRLRGQTQEMQQSLEQQQENGVHHRQELRDSLAAKEEEMVAQTQTLQDARLDLHEAQRRLTATTAALSEADAQNKLLIEGSKVQLKELDTARKAHATELQEVESAWNARIKTMSSEHLDALGAAQQDAKARWKQAEEQHHEDIDSIRSRSQATTTDVQQQLQTVEEQSRTLREDHTRCTHEMQTLRQCLFLVLDLDDGAHTSIGDVRAAAETELDRRRATEKACRDAEESAQEGRTQLASLQRMHQQLVEASKTGTDLLQRELDSAQKENAVARESMREQAAAIEQVAEQASVDAWKVESTAAQLERAVLDNKRLSNANAAVKEELGLMRERVEHVNSVVGPTADHLRKQLDGLTQDAESATERSKQALLRQQEQASAELHVLRQQHATELEAQHKDRGQAEYLRDEVEVLKQHSADSDARCRDLASQLDKVISSMNQSAESATSEDAHTLEAAIATINGISTRLGEKDETLQMVREQEQLIGIARGAEAAADSRCRILTEKAALLRSEQRQALAKLSMKDAEVQRLEDRLKAQEGKTETAQKKLREDHDSNRAALEASKEAVASAAQQAMDAQREVSRLQSQADVENKQHKAAQDVAEQRLAELDHEQKVHAEAAARAQELNAAEVQGTLLSTEQRCRELSVELTAVRDREQAANTSVRDEHSKSEQLVTQHRFELELLKQQAQLKLTAADAEHVAAVQAARAEHSDVKKDAGVSEQSQVEMTQKADKWKLKAKHIEKKRRLSDRRVEEQEHALRTAQAECDATVGRVRGQCAMEVAAAQGETMAAHAAAKRDAERALVEASETAEHSSRSLKVIVQQNEQLQAELQQSEQAIAAAIADSERYSGKYQGLMTELTEANRARNAVAQEREAAQQDVREINRQLEDLKRSADERTTEQLEELKRFTNERVSTQLQFDQKLTESTQTTEKRLSAEHSSFLAQVKEHHQRELMDVSEKTRKLEAHVHALECEVMSLQHKYQAEAQASSASQKMLSQTESALTTLETRLAESEAQRIEVVKTCEELTHALDVASRNVALGEATLARDIAIVEAKLKDEEAKLVDEVSVLQDKNTMLARDNAQVEQDLSNALQELDSALRDRNESPGVEHTGTSEELAESRLAYGNLETSLRDLQATVAANDAEHQRQDAEHQHQDAEHQRQVDAQAASHSKEMQDLISTRDMVLKSHNVTVVHLQQRCKELVVVRQEQAQEFDAQRTGMVAKLGKAEQARTALGEQLRVAHEKTQRLMADMDARNNEFQAEVKLLSDSVVNAQAEMEQGMTREARQHDRQLVELREEGEEELRLAKRDHTRQLSQVQEDHESALSTASKAASKRWEGAKKEVTVLKESLESAKSDLKFSAAELDRNVTLLELERRNVRASSSKASSSGDEAERLSKQLRDESHAHSEALDLARRQARDERERAADLATEHRREERELRTQLDEQRTAVKSSHEEHARSVVQVADLSELLHKQKVATEAAAASAEHKCEELLEEMSSIREDQSMERSGLLDSLQKVTERVNDIAESAIRSPEASAAQVSMQNEEYFTQLSVEVRELKEAQVAAASTIASGLHETSHTEMVALSTQFSATVRTLLDELHQSSTSPAAAAPTQDAAGATNATAANPLVPLDRLETARVAEQECRAELIQCKGELQRVQADLDASIECATSASAEVDKLQRLIADTSATGPTIKTPPRTSNAPAPFSPEHVAPAADELSTLPTSAHLPASPAGAESPIPSASESATMPGSKSLSQTSEATAKMMLSHDVMDARRKLRAMSYTDHGHDPHSLLSMYDKDRSGELGWDEFRSAVRKGGKLQADGPRGITDAQLRRLFAVADKNGSGMVSVTELTRFVWGNGIVDEMKSLLHMHAALHTSARDAREALDRSDAGVTEEAGMMDFSVNATQNPSDSQMAQVESEIQHQLERLEGELGQAQARAQAAEDQAMTQQLEELKRSTNERVSTQLQFDQKLTESTHTTEKRLSAEHSSFLAQVKEHHQRELTEKEEEMRLLQQAYEEEKMRLVQQHQAMTEQEQGLRAAAKASKEALHRAQAEFAGQIAQGEADGREREERHRVLLEEVSTLRAKCSAASAQLTLVEVKQERAETQLAALRDEIKRLSAELFDKNAEYRNAAAARDRVELDLQKLRATEADSAAAARESAIVQETDSMKLRQENERLEEMLRAKTQEELVGIAEPVGMDATFYPVYRSILSEYSHHPAADGYGR